MLSIVKLLLIKNDIVGQRRKDEAKSERGRENKSNICRERTAIPYTILFVQGTIIFFFFHRQGLKVVNKASS